MSAAERQGADNGGRGSGPSYAAPARLQLLAKVICPHCWHKFDVADTLWISRHAELMGDPVVGTDAASRFLPSRFNADGDALDARGMACQELACPACHLTLPRACLEIDPLFMSIVGVPSSGKSYFLTSMTWELRRTLMKHFSVLFNDADPVTNRILNGYEELLFLPEDPKQPVAIRKTEAVGTALYDEIRRGQQLIRLPRPFLFSFKPTGKHPNVTQPTSVSRLLVMYDNAGEAFDPGEDTSASPVTQHLAHSRVLMFLYDPTQDARFRERCRTVSDDPQLIGKSRRQETVLLEAITRIRRFARLGAGQKHDKPLIVIVPKADVWAKLINLDLDHEPVLPGAIHHGALAGVDFRLIESTSAAIRNLLIDVAPEFVAAVEDFARHVVYIPVSALGRGPTREPDRDGLFIRAADIKPKWVTVPMLYAFSKWATGLIGGAGIPTPVGTPMPVGGK